MSSDASVRGTVPVRVRDVVRDVVAEVAPEESSVIAGLAQFDDAAVVRLLGRKGSRREQLGFGPGEIAVVVTPVVWLVVDQAARQIGSAAADGATVGARSLLRRVLRRRSAEVTVPSLTPDQLVEVHRQVLDAATGRGFERERAEVLADAVMARLMLSSAQAQAQAQTQTQTDESANGGRTGDASPRGDNSPEE